MKRLLTLLAWVISLSTSNTFATSVRVVDFGADLGWGELFYRGEAVERANPSQVDRDKNGTTDNDWTSTWPFSLEKPLSMPGLRYDTDAKNAVFYGGLALHSCHPANPKSPRSISEGHLNSNHEFRDDLNFMGGLADHGKEEQVEAYANWFWQKKDFLNGGDQHPVSFDATSKIVVHVSRYWGGFHAGRWMVRNGDRFYLSQATFANSTKAYTLTRENNKEVESAAMNPVVHTSHALEPDKTTWAEYRPQESLDFDAKNASFAPVKFDDVTAVGFFVNRDLSPVQKVATGLRPPLAFKWNAFRCDAVVQRPADYHLKMLPITSANGSPAFHLAEGETTFKLWQAMLRIGVTNQTTHHLGNIGYALTRDGAMGSMEVDDLPHSAEEPVTGISWHDAIAFCNILSEMEGLTPAYYADANFQTVLRRVIDRDLRENWDKRPSVYWNTAANGYRLPTGQEWATAYQSSPASTNNKQPLPASASEPAPNGLRQMQGNVWEYIWDTDGTSADGSVAKRTVVGGDFRSPTPPTQTGVPDFNDRPWHGSPYIGFRVARNAAAPATPSPIQPDSIALWSFSTDTAIPSGTTESRDTVADFVRNHLKFASLPAGLANETEEIPPETLHASNKAIAMAQNDRFLKKITDQEAEKIIKENTLAVTRPSPPFPLDFGTTEIPYSLWKRVRHWAENHGYRFNYLGDMGSMRHATDKGMTHEQNEPVTYLSWYDTVVWCNALSELLGKTPVYYADKAFTTPYKLSIQFRLDTFADDGNPVLPWATKMEKGARIHTGSADIIFFKSQANGIRLPLDIEFKEINRQPPADKVAELDWNGDNAGDKTHPVATRQASEHGLYDMNGNVFEWGWDSKSSNYEFQNSAYEVNGNGYFYEPYDKTKPRSEKKPHAYGDFTGNAKPFLGFRVVTKH